MRAALAAAAALALSLALGAGAAGASPIPGTLGLQLTPAPMHVDDVRAFVATNLSGGLALAVTLTPSAGYAVDPATFELAPDASQEVAITAVDPSADGTLSALASADVDGAVRSAIALSTRFVHATWLERNPAAPVLAFLALAALALGVVILRRRVRP